MPAVPANPQQVAVRGLSDSLHIARTYNGQVWIATLSDGSIRALVFYSIGQRKMVYDPVLRQAHSERTYSNYSKLEIVRKVPYGNGAQWREKTDPGVQQRPEFTKSEPLAEPASTIGEKKTA